MKFLILTTEEKTLKWKSLPQKLKAIQKALTNVWSIEIKHFGGEVHIKGDRVDRDWLGRLTKSYFDQGYDVVALHMSIKQKKDLGIKPTLRGSNPRRKSEVGDFYFWANERTKRDGENQFVQTCLHEFAHEYYQQTGIVDMTHNYHDQNPDISGLFTTFNWFKYQPKRMKLKKIRNLLQRIIELQKALIARRKEAGSKRMLQPLVKRQADKIVYDMKMLGHPVRVVEGYRSIERQDELYAQGRTTAGNIVTNAKGGQSFHNYGVAVDFVFRKEGYNASEFLWGTLGTVGKEHGFKWGGDWKNFKDRPHFEMTLGNKLKDYQEGNIDWSVYN